jgi:HK97 family phage portal protein
MGFLDRVRNYFGKEVVNKYNANALTQIGFVSTAYNFNKLWTIQTALLKNPDVYSVISQQANKVASVPYYVRDVRDEEQLKRYDFARKNIDFQSQLKTKAKAFKSDYFPLPLETPNPLQNWNDFFYLTEMYYRATGNFFWYVLRNSLNQPIGIWVLPAHYMKIYVKPNNESLELESPIAGYEMFQSPNVSIPFTADEVIHGKMPNPEWGINSEHLYGLSPLSSAYYNIENQIQANKHLSKMFQSSGAFGFISVDGEHLSPQQAEQFADRIKEMDASKERMAKIAGISTKITFTRIALANDELMPWDALKWDRKTICNVLGWSDELLNNDGKSGLGGSEAKEARKQVIGNTIQPDLIAIEEAFNKKFLSLFPKYQNKVLKFDVSQLPEMQEDIERLNKWAKEAPITMNEWREMINFERLEEDGMDSVFVSRNLQPIEMAYLNSNMLNDLKLEGESE